MRSQRDLCAGSAIEALSFAFAILHSPLRGCAGDRVKMVLKCIVGLFGGRIFNMAANSFPKTVPQCTLTTISTRSPAQPQSGESGHGRSNVT